MLEDYVEEGDRVKGTLLQVNGPRFEQETHEFRVSYEIHGVRFQGEEKKPYKII